MVWRKMMNNTHRENGTMAGPLIFTVPAYGFVMALYLDWLGRTPTQERFPLTQLSLLGANFAYFSGSSAREAA
jgi:hypothetical protein